MKNVIREYKNFRNNINEEYYFGFGQYADLRH